MLCHTSTQQGACPHHCNLPAEYAFSTSFDKFSLSRSPSVYSLWGPPTSQSSPQRMLTE